MRIKNTIVITFALCACTLKGQLEQIATLEDKELRPGQYTYLVKASEPGIYFLRANVGDKVVTKKVIII